MGHCKSVKCNAVIALLALVLGSLAAWLITRQITEPLRRTLQAAQCIAKGDLRSDLRVSRQDELGQLQNSMQQMALSLRELIGGIGQGTGQLTAAVGELSSVAERTQVMTGNQKDETDQVATAMNEMAATVLEVARNAEFASAAATAADSQAREGNQVVNDAIGQIEQLARQVEESILAMQQLAQESELLAGLSRSLDERLAVFRLGNGLSRDLSPGQAPRPSPSRRTDQYPHH